MEKKEIYINDDFFKELNERLSQGESISIAEIEEHLLHEYGFPSLGFHDDIYGLKSTKRN